MAAAFGIPLACWVCALIARPRRPRLGNEVEELVYLRLLGRQHRLLLLALIVTALMFITVALSLPARISPDPLTPPEARSVCDSPAILVDGFCV